MKVKTLQVIFKFFQFHFSPLEKIIIFYFIFWFGSNFKCIKKDKSLSHSCPIPNRQPLIGISCLFLQRHFMHMQANRILYIYILFPFIQDIIYGFLQCAFLRLTRYHEDTYQELLMSSFFVFVLFCLFVSGCTRRQVGS